MTNKYRALTCHSCGKRRNLVWDPAHEECYECYVKGQLKRVGV